MSPLMLLWTLVSCVLAEHDLSNNYAIIIAASSDYYNYRHQANGCHLYRTLRENGYDENHLVHINFDDAAGSQQNPHKDKLFSNPISGDVREGCKIHYEGVDIHAPNILNALSGSFFPDMNKNSTLFVYFNSINGPGVISLPNNELIFIEEILSALHHLWMIEKLGKLVLYLD
jgi:legumain